MQRRKDIMDSNSGNVKRYVIGALAKLQEAFPGYSRDDVRASIDGKLAIYEVNLSEDNLSALKLMRSLKAYAPAEIQAVLCAPESSGVWYAPEDSNDTP